MYLQPVFSGGSMSGGRGRSKIQEELASEARAFQGVDQAYREIMKKTREDPNALRTVTRSQLREQLMKHNLTLDYVQKGLERFLDRKRRAFARFYFLSNDDLLNILSNAQDARAVQQHVQKMFDNVASLRLEEVTGGTVDVTHLVSAEGEAFKLGRNLKVHGEVDEWLGNVELNMKA